MAVANNGLPTHNGTLSQISKSAPSNNDILALHKISKSLKESTESNHDNSDDDHSENGNYDQEMNATSGKTENNVSSNIIDLFMLNWY